jgi:hypothetical protein
LLSGKGNKRSHTSPRCATSPQKRQNRPCSSSTIFISMHQENSHDDACHSRTDENSNDIFCFHNNRPRDLHRAMRHESGDSSFTRKIRNDESPAKLQFSTSYLTKRNTSKKCPKVRTFRASMLKEVFYDVSTLQFCKGSIPWRSHSIRIGVPKFHGLW